MEGNKYLTNFYLFLRRPNPYYRFNLTFLLKFKYLFLSFFVIFFGAFVSALIRHVLQKATIIPQYVNSAKDLLIENYSIITVHVIVVLVVPIVEELTFRSLLVFSKINVAVSSSLIFYLVFSDFTGGMYIINSAAIFKIALTLIVFISVFFILKNNRNCDRLKSFWERNYLKIFYSSAIVFGYLHLTNFGELNLEKIFFSPVIVLPFIIYGIVLGFVRVSMGLKWSILLHIMLNAFVGLIKVI